MMVDSISPFTPSSVSSLHCTGQLMFDLQIESTIDYSCEVRGALCLPTGPAVAVIGR